MEQADLRSWERQCTQDDMPKCRAACPLQMDVRPFLERMAHGDVPGARKVLERHLPLPGVLGRICEHPCETACVRQELGGPLAVGALERVCVSQCAQQTRNLPRPPKSKKVAVIGDGMAGLVAAWDLSRKAYPVDLFYAGGRPAEGLIAAFPVLTPEALDGELEAMQKSGVTLIRRDPDQALFQEVEGYDAVFVDVSCAPGLAPASRDAVDSVTLNVAGGPEHVCFGGGGAPAAAPPAPAAPVDMKSLKLTPKARKLVQDEGIDPASLTQIKGTGFQGGITYKDLKASPLARRVAQQMGVDLAAVQGTGAAGKIMKADVEAAAAKAAPASAGSDTRQVASAVPYKGVRRIIGEKLAQSKFTAPHLYFTDAVDTTELAAFRRQLNETSEVKIAVSDLLTMAACKALKKFPGINVTLKDDQVVTYRSINVGTAVAGDNGLVVPVIKNVQNKTLTDVARESKDLVARAREGRLAPEEYSEGTFSISNLGMFGIGNFTAIINAPESAILSVSSVRKTPVVATDENGEDAIAIRPMMNIQLSVDHRVIDGLLASQFVEYMKQLLEHPIQILM